MLTAQINWQLKRNCATMYSRGRQSGWGWGTTSDDYHAHISRIAKAPSVLTDVPQYPNVHVIFGQKVAREGGEEIQKPNQSPKQKKKVQIAGTEQIIENDRNESIEVHEEDVDTEASNYIQRKKKGFELCKWTTFKLR